MKTAKKITLAEATAAAEKVRDAWLNEFARNTDDIVRSLLDSKVKDIVFTAIGMDRVWSNEWRVTARDCYGNINPLYKVVQNFAKVAAEHFAIKTLDDARLTTKEIEAIDKAVRTAYLNELKEQAVEQAKARAITDASTMIANVLDEPDHSGEIEDAVAMLVNRDW